MTQIRFEPSGREIEVEGPEALIDVLDELPGTRVQLCCRAAHCGACRVVVEAGEHSLWPALSDELDTKARLGFSERERLACQLRLKADAVDVVRLRVLAGSQQGP